jgi:hypothetical protein
MYRLFKTPPVLNPIVVPVNKIQSQTNNNNNNNNSVFNTSKFSFSPLKIIIVPEIKRTTIPKQMLEGMPNFVLGLTYLN